MKILAIGDPHGDIDALKNIPKDVDIILINGDLGKADLMRKMAFRNARREVKGLDETHFSHIDEKDAYMEAYDSTIELIKYLSQYAKVFTIFGNVEKSNRRTKLLSLRLGLKLPFLKDDLLSMSNVDIINNKVVTFKGVRIGGLQYFLDYHSVIYLSYHEELMKRTLIERERAKKTLEKLGSVDILLCHQPPFGILDYAESESLPKEIQGHVGSKIILDYVVKHSPKFVICGHIHESKGVKKLGSTTVHNLGLSGFEILTF